MMITNYNGNKYLYFNTNEKDTEKRKMMPEFAVHMEQN